MYYTILAPFRLHILQSNSKINLSYTLKFCHFSARGSRNIEMDKEQKTLPALYDHLKLGGDEGGWGAYESRLE